MTHHDDEDTVDWPATPGGDPGGEHPHAHPLPLWVRASLLAYAALFPLVIGALVALVLQGNRAEARADERARVANDRQVAAVAAELDRRTVALAEELDRRTAARNAQRASDAARLNQLVCTVLAADLRPTVSTRALAAELRCDLPAQVQPPAATAQEQAGPAMTPSAANEPRPGSDAAPSPSTAGPATTAPAPPSSPRSVQPSAQPSPSPGAAPGAPLLCPLLGPLGLPCP